MVSNDQEGVTTNDTENLTVTDGEWTETSEVVSETTEVVSDEGVIPEAGYQAV